MQPIASCAFKRLKEFLLETFAYYSSALLNDVHVVDKELCFTEPKHNHLQSLCWCFERAQCKHKVVIRKLENEPTDFLWGWTFSCFEYILPEPAWFFMKICVLELVTPSLWLEFSLYNKEKWCCGRIRRCKTSIVNNATENTHFFGGEFFILFACGKILMPVDRTYKMGKHFSLCLSQRKILNCIFEKRSPRSSLFIFFPPKKIERPKDFQRAMSWCCVTNSVIAWQWSWPSYGGADVEVT